MVTELIRRQKLASINEVQNLPENRRVDHVRVEVNQVVMKDKGFEVDTAGCQDILVGPKKGIFYYYDHITQITFGSLLV